MVELTQKQENFCLAYIETGSATEAYRQAYNAENMQAETIHVKACELLKHDKVSVRVETLQSEQKTRHDVTVDSLCLELEEARKGALGAGQYGATVQSIMGKAKLHGLGLEKRETKLTAEMSAEEATEILNNAGINLEADDG